MNQTPESIRDVEQLEQMLSSPPDYLVQAMRRVDGDILVLGVSGKMGPTLARMARRALDACRSSARVFGAARFSDESQQRSLESWGIQTFRADLLDEDQLKRLPDAPNIVYMAGMKFGSTANAGLTWAMNCFLPGMVCRRFPKSRIAAFSTGNVYGLSPTSAGGSKEADALNPVGEYAMSCVGRERIFEYFSRTRSIAVSIIRLYYATEMRYGVLVDLATKVWRNEEIDISMGHFNAIWQQDANAQSLATLAHASNPPFVINVVGPELLNMREIAIKLGKLLGREPRMKGAPAADALIGSADRSTKLFGKPSVGIDQMLQWIVQWTRQGGQTLNKPTHFEQRTGKF
jgi:nucleoside-diphosphate-sugar epimerase